MASFYVATELLAQMFGIESFDRFMIIPARAEGELGEHLHFVTVFGQSIPEAGLFNPTFFKDADGSISIGWGDRLDTEDHATCPEWMVEPDVGRVNCVLPENHEGRHEGPAMPWGEANDLVLSRVISWDVSDTTQPAEL